MKLIETSHTHKIGGGFSLVGLAPEFRFSGEGNPQSAPSQIPPMQFRPVAFAVTAFGVRNAISVKRH